LKLSLEELRGLPQQRLKIDFHESLAGLETVKPVVGDLSIIAGASGVHLSGRVQTLLKLTCHTCLKPYFQALKLELDERFVYEHYLSETNRDIKEKELLTRDFVESIPYAGSIDISETVYQAVTLATPTYCSCGSECAGLPLYNIEKPPDNAVKAQSRAGDQPAATIDPRWKNLKTLFPSKESR